jgi:ribonuclease BN (tRNA processing enzyme)
VKLKFWGTHGGYPTERQMTCMQLITAQANWLIDLGSQAIFSDAQTLCAVDTVLLTHLHSDHALMLPHFVLARLRLGCYHFHPEDLTIFAPEPLDHLLVNGGFEAGMFPESCQVPPVHRGIAIHTLPTHHPRLCWAYKLQVEGQTLVFSGDTAYFPGFSTFCAGADWLFIECNDSDERSDHAQTFGHMTPAGVARVISEAHPQHTVLYHFDMLSPEDTLRAVHHHLQACAAFPAAGDTLISCTEGLVLEF